MDTTVSIWYTDSRQLYTTWEGEDMAESESAEDLMTIGEAREYLGIGRQTMANLIKRGVLTTTVDPLDRRIRLVNRAEVVKLRQQSKSAA
jgi:excisionase family DNA binding protein